MKNAAPIDLNITAEEFKRAALEQANIPDDVLTIAEQIGGLKPGALIKQRDNTMKQIKKIKTDTAQVPDSYSQFKDVRRAAVPLVLYETADPAATVKGCWLALNGSSDASPVLQHDIVRGLVGVNEAGRNAANELEATALTTSNPVECLSMLFEKADKIKTGLVFMLNAHQWLKDPGGIQAAWNCRDLFKSPAVAATLVMLAPSGSVPLELKQDVISLTDALPGPQELSGLVERISKQAKKAGADVDVDALKNDGVVIDSLLGLSAFGAEQIFSMSVRKSGIDRDSLWDKKRRMIEQTPGLQVWKGGESFDELGGLSNLKDFLRRVLTSGKTPVRAIGFIDEIEKGMAGAAGDTSGTSQDQLQVFLKVMQDLNIPGMIFVGPPGTGKSAIAKAAGSVAEAPVVAIDTGAMKASLVGESEGRIRSAMEVFRAISQGKGLFIATCNKIATLPPELRRRFSLGTFYIDLPNSEEQKFIWQLWRKRFEIDSMDKTPLCEGWTGAEIRACCDVSYRTGLSLVESAKFIVPVCKSAADQIEALRKAASGRFISASRPGVYQYNQQSQQTSVEAGERAVSV